MLASPCGDGIVENSFYLTVNPSPSGSADSSPERSQKFGFSLDSKSEVLSNVRDRIDGDLKRIIQEKPILLLNRLRRSTLCRLQPH